MILRSLLASVFLISATGSAQTEPRQLRAFLEPSLQTPDVVAFQLRQYLIRKTPKLPSPTSADRWTTEAKRLRKTVLDEVVFHGWPREWVEAPLKVEDL